jgi:hypothetical protein
MVPAAQTQREVILPNDKGVESWNGVTGMVAASGGSRLGRPALSRRGMRVLRLARVDWRESSSLLAAASLTEQQGAVLRPAVRQGRVWLTCPARY